MNRQLKKTFLELVDIDEMYPSEKRILEYIKSRLSAAKVLFEQDNSGNIVALLDVTGSRVAPLAICGHVDIAAPLVGRQVIETKNYIRTDGKSLLGGDDKTAVAAMLTLADDVASGDVVLQRPVELIFTIGEEAGLVGAMSLDMSLVRAKEVLVFDWVGAVNHIVSISPAYYKIDVIFTGKDAHPALWQQGKNAGAALMKAASTLPQGQFTGGVFFNIGIVTIGNARNKVPGSAMLMAELRSYDMAKIEQAKKQITNHFMTVAGEYEIKAKVAVITDTHAYALRPKDSSLLSKVADALEFLGLLPCLEETYGCFDGNILAARRIDTVILGGAYYNPHSPDEYVDVREFEQMYAFIKVVAAQSSIGLS